jgi:tetratricopeptide (TPR) repeat protein
MNKQTYISLAILLFSLTIGVYLVRQNWKSATVALDVSTQQDSTNFSFDESEFVLAVAEDIANQGYSISTDFPTAFFNKEDTLISLSNRAEELGLPSVLGMYQENLAAITGDDSFKMSAARYLVVASSFASEPRSKQLYIWKARKIMESFTQDNPNSIDGKVLYAYILVRTDPAPMKGIGLLTQVLSTHPEQTDALYMLGEFSIESGQFEKALERFKKLLSLRPLNADYYFKVSEVFSRMNQKDSADYYLKQGISYRKQN